jgi:hypothetical protein
VGRGLPRRRDAGRGRGGNRPGGAGPPAGVATAGSELGACCGCHDDDATSGDVHQHGASGVLLVDDHVADEHDRHDQHDHAATDEYDQFDQHDDAATDDYHHDAATDQYGDVLDDEPDDEPDVEPDDEPDVELDDNLDDVGHHVGLRDDHHHAGAIRRDDVVVALTDDAAADGIGRGAGRMALTRLPRAHGRAPLAIP